MSRDDDKLGKEMLRQVMSHLGKRGGKANAARLTPEQRKRLGRKLARARWSKKPKRMAEAAA